MAEYLIWSNEHSAWWGPDECGYTKHIERAGRYEREHALRICVWARGGRRYHENPTEVPILYADAIAFWPDDEPGWEAARAQHAAYLRSL